MKRNWKQNLDSFNDLDYIKLVGVPMRSSRQGPIIDLRPLFLERLVARALLASRTPLRGKEVRFLRKASELSLDKFAHKLGLTSSAVFYWEKAGTERLAPINEVAVRTLCAEEFGVEIPGHFSNLLGVDPAQILTLEISHPRKPYKARQKPNAPSMVQGKKRVNAQQTSI